MGRTTIQRTTQSDSVVTTRVAVMSNDMLREGAVNRVVCGGYATDSGPASELGFNHKNEAQPHNAGIVK